MAHVKTDFWLRMDNFIEKNGANKWWNKCQDMVHDVIFCRGDNYIGLDGIFLGRNKENNLLVSSLDQDRVS